MTDRCLFCGEVIADADHFHHCDGRQGRIEAFEQVRVTDPDTSHAAAWSLDDVTEVQRRVLVIHWRHRGRGLTDEELLQEYLREWLSAESSPRKRRHDLTRHGVIVDSGERRDLISGRKGIVWKLAAHVVIAAA